MPFFFLKNLRHRYLAPKYLSILWCLLPRDRLSSHALDPHPSSENSIKHATSFLYFLILLCTSVFKHIQGLSVHGLVKTNKLKINTSHPSFTPPPRAAVFIAFLAVFLPSNRASLACIPTTSRNVFAMSPLILFQDSLGTYLTWHL